jgi:4-hydroxy-3-methylbut-2-en-1-yl diphosphate synthase IspG/GcpE
MRRGKTPKKLDSICCPQCGETKADTLKQLKPIGEGDQEVEKRSVREELT